MKNDPLSHPDSDQPALPSVSEQGVAEDQAVQLPGFRAWDEFWMPIVNSHRGWWDRHGDFEPVYCLPEAVIEALVPHVPAIRDTQGSRPKKALIAKSDADAERAFGWACRGFAPDTVGVWLGAPIRYPGLTAAEVTLNLPPEIAEQFSQINNTSDAQFTSTLDALKDKLEANRHQTLGAAGRLTFDRQYRRELETLKQMWSCLSPKPRLNVGSATVLGPGVRVPQVPGMERCSPEIAAFYDAYGKFIKNRTLASLVTWDLPLPQGPLPGHAGAVVLLRGTDAPVDCHSPYYDIPSDEDVRKGIRQRQRRDGRDAGVEMEFPLTDTSARYDTLKKRYLPSTFETAFRMWLIEETVCRRYGRVHGIKSRLQDVFSRMFGIASGRVNKITQIYHEFLTC